MAYLVFTPTDVEQVLRSSKCEPIEHRGEQAGHAGAKHLLLTSVELLQRCEDMIRAE